MADNPQKQHEWKYVVSGGPVGIFSATRDDAEYFVSSLAHQWEGRDVTATSTADRRYTIHYKHQTTTFDFPFEVSVDTNPELQHAMNVIRQHIDAMYRAQGETGEIHTEIVLTTDDKRTETH